MSALDEEPDYEEEQEEIVEDKVADGKDSRKWVIVSICCQWKWNWIFAGTLIIGKCRWNLFKMKK